MRPSPPRSPSSPTWSVSAGWPRTASPLPTSTCTSPATRARRPGYWRRPRRWRSTDPPPAAATYLPRKQDTSWGGTRRSCRPSSVPSGPSRAAGDDHRRRGRVTRPVLVPRPARGAGGRPARGAGGGPAGPGGVRAGRPTLDQPTLDRRRSASRYRGRDAGCGRRNTPVPRPGWVLAIAGRRGSAERGGPPADEAQHQRHQRDAADGRRDQQEPPVVAAAGARRAGQSAQPPDDHGHGENRQPDHRPVLENGGPDGGEADRGAGPGQFGPLLGQPRGAVFGVAAGRVQGVLTPDT